MNLNNRRIIINNDFDGCLSGMALIKLYNCKIVGFSNSKNRLWFVDNEQFIGDELFVDMFTPYYDSIDNHIPPYMFDNSLSPNKERNIYAFENYRSKYPFSTFVWLLTIAAKEGKKINEILPQNFNVNNIPTMSDVIFRADDTLLNCYKYKTNCVDWIDFLICFSNQNESIKQLFNLTQKIKQEDVERWKINTDIYFNKKYKFDKEEIPDITTPESNIFFNRMGIKFNKITNTIILEHNRTNLKDINEFKKLSTNLDKKLFSFAFVYSPLNNNKKNFSYSLI